MRKPSKFLMKIKVGPELSDMYIYAKSNQEVLVMHGFRNEYFDELLPQELKRFYGWQSKNTMDVVVCCEDPVNRIGNEGLKQKIMWLGVFKYILNTYQEDEMTKNFLTSVEIRFTGKEPKEN